MSNPGVIKLEKYNKGGQRFWLDDNIGESVHVHLNDLRLDLTIAEFSAFSDSLYDIINGMVQVDGFDARKFNPVFLALLLARELPNLKRVQMDEVQLSRLLLYKPVLGPFVRSVRLPKSKVVKALNGDTRENDVGRASHHINQTSAERLDAVMASVREHGYPYGDEYIVLYDDNLLIRDGQHRAACLYHLHGDIKVPVMRLYFSGRKQRGDFDRLMRYNFRKAVELLRNAARALVKPHTYKHAAKRLYKKLYFTYYKQTHKQYDSLIERAFSQKI